MKARYRIIKEGKGNSIAFYPQYKKWIFWEYFQCHLTYVDRIFNHYTKVSFKTEKEAADYIHNHHMNLEIKKNMAKNIKKVVSHIEF
jgi:hypothetical protein